MLSRLALLACLVSAPLLAAPPTTSTVAAPADTLPAIALLEPNARASALRDLLASTQEAAFDEEAAFIHEAALRAPLRGLVQDPEVGRTAVMLLATIAVPEDVSYLLAHHPAPKALNDEDYEGWENRWAYFIETALIARDDKPALDFLEACADGTYGDLWVDQNALMMLSFADPERARPILERAAARNDYRRALIGKLLDKPTPLPAAALVTADPLAAAKLFGPSLDMKTYRVGDKPVYNLARDKLRVTLIYRQDGNDYGYTLTYHRQADAQWHLRAVREAFFGDQAE